MTGFESKDFTDSFRGKGEHEKKISDLFNGNMAYQGKAIFKSKLYILAFTNRSGSNLLADYMRQTGFFYGLNEALNWDEVELRAEREKVSSFPDYIISQVSNENKNSHWGVKASWDQMIMLARFGVTDMFSSVKVIHSVRTDLVGQAVSLWIAHQTGKWTSNHRSSDMAPEYDRKPIDKIIKQISNANCNIDCISRALKWQRAAVIYENLTNDPELVINRIGKFVSADFSKWRADIPKISKQRDQLNADFSQKTLNSWAASIKNSENL